VKVWPVVLIGFGLVLGLFMLGIDLFGVVSFVWNGVAGVLKFLVYDLAPLWFILLFVFAVSRRHVLQSNYRDTF